MQRDTGSNLPPGCTFQQIEDALGSDCCECCGEVFADGHTDLGEWLDDPKAQHEGSSLCQGCWESDVVAEAQQADWEIEERRHGRE